MSRGWPQLAGFSKKPILQRLKDSVVAVWPSGSICHIELLVRQLVGKAIGRLDSNVAFFFIDSEVRHNPFTFSSSKGKLTAFWYFLLNR